MNQAKLEKIVLLIGIILVAFASSFIGFYYYNLETSKCIENPLVYGANAYSKANGREYQGSLYYYEPNTITPTIYFNSTSIDIGSNHLG